MQVWIGVILSVTILIFIIALLFLMDRISRSAKKMNDAQIELTKANAEIEYNTQVFAVIDTFREIKHDYASHITAISACKAYHFPKGKYHSKRQLGISLFCPQF